MFLLSLLFLMQDSAEDLAAGKALFQGQCAVCHGIDGHGSTGPTLVRPRLPRAATQDALIKVIAQGIPNTGMPAAWQMTPREVKQTALYVKSIGTVAQETKLPGDPAKGKEVYRKTGCASCHIIDGQGNGYGPELTGVGLRRSAQHLRDSVLKPAADVPGESLTVRVVNQQGTQTVGVRLNEDSFSIQLRDMSGRIHSFQKANLKTLEKQKDVSLMPAFDQLSPEDLDDLVHYLTTLRGIQ